MKGLKQLFYLFPLTFIACVDEPQPDVIEASNEVNEFVWGSLNSWYYWQEDVPDLSDNRFGSRNDLNAYLNSFSDPSSLFDNLNYVDDRFSWIVDDYEELQSRFQGTSKSFGYEFTLLRVQDSLLGYVEYVLPGAPADVAGIQRGNVFSQIDGTTLTLDNYLSLLNAEAYEITLVDFDENGSFTGNQRSIPLTAITLTENPVLTSEVLEVNGLKVGYLTYNSFTYTFHRELNAVFTKFKSQNIEELVIDLRYNSGGRVSTSQALASMICGYTNESDVFSYLSYNSKHSVFDQSFNFINTLPILNGSNQVIDQEPVSRLNLDRVYILTGRNTASASEMLINGLEPYMEVTVIGVTTVGKNEGSLTLYDSPGTDYLDVSSANPSHKWALQPIVSKVLNSEFFGDYALGLEPDIELRESDVFYDLKPLGDPNEYLLKAALDDIQNLGTVARTASRIPVEAVFSSHDLDPRKSLLHISPANVPQL